MWNSNALLYGSDLNTMYHKVQKMIQPGNKPLHVTVTPIQGGNANVRSTTQHQEFDFSACYNVAAIASCVAMVHEIASHRRYGGIKHKLFLHAINCLNQSHMYHLRAVVERYSDRTCFILTTTKLSQVPRSLLFACTPLRVPSHPPKLSEDLLDNWLMAMIKTMKTTPRGKLTDLMIKFRDFAYTCIGFNVSFSFVAKRLIDILQDTDMNVIHQVIGICARNEAAICCMKKDVLAWELAFMEITNLLNIL